MSLRLPDSGAEVTPDGRRHAPSAARNAAPILEVLRREAPATGRVLEIAAGTGQHAATFARALPGLLWQPTDVSPDTFASIRAWAAFAGARIAEPARLDAGQSGWAAAWAGQDLILVVNLLHLIPAAAAETVLAEAARALAPGGRLMIYGPFLRDGQPTSEGDAAFDASLRMQDPAIGYKDLGWVVDILDHAGLSCRTEAMPANNLMLVAFKD